MPSYKHAFPRQHYQLLESHVSPMRELMKRLQIKVLANSQYKIFEVDLARIQEEINRVCNKSLEQICKAENADRGPAGAALCSATAAEIGSDLVFLKHHCAGAKAATARFAGILGVEVPKIGK